MSFWIYFAVFAAVVIADQYSKRWATGTLPALAVGDAGRGFGWILSSPRALERLGVRWAVLVWVLAGAGGAALCLLVPAGGLAALGGVAAWAAAASNLGEWWQRGAVVDWLRPWPRLLTNLADLVLVVGPAQMLVVLALA